MYCHIQLMKNILWYQQCGLIEPVVTVQRVCQLFSRGSWMQITACNPLERRTVVTSDSCTQFKWWVKPWTPSVYASWQEQVTLPKTGSSPVSTRGSSKYVSFLSLQSSIRLSSQVNFHFYHLTLRVVNSSCGMSCVDPSGSTLNPSPSHSLPWLWGCQPGWIHQQEYLALYFLFGYVHGVYQDEMGGGKKGKVRVLILLAPCMLDLCKSLGSMYWGPRFL